MNRKEKVAQRRAEIHKRFRAVVAKYNPETKTEILQHINADGGFPVTIHTLRKARSAQRHLDWSYAKSLPNDGVNYYVDAIHTRFRAIVDKHNPATLEDIVKKMNSRWTTPNGTKVTKGSVNRMMKAWRILDWSYRGDSDAHRERYVRKCLYNVHLNDYPTLGSFKSIKGIGERWLYKSHSPYSKIFRDLLDEFGWKPLTQRNDHIEPMLKLLFRQHGYLKKNNLAEKCNELGLTTHTGRVFQNGWELGRFFGEFGIDSHAIYESVLKEVIQEQSGLTVTALSEYLNDNGFVKPIALRSRGRMMVIEEWCSVSLAEYLLQ